jgi:uncharacterized protein DUF1553/uncharacterized protein DUF1549/cytochrome c
MKHLFAASLTMLALAWLHGLAAPPADKPARKISYARDIQPILATNCFLCHGPDVRNRKAGLRLDVREEAIKALKSGARAIVPGDPGKSELIARIHAEDSERMPPAKTKKTLKESEKELLRQWIGQGAVYQKHWAFMPPERPAVPAIKNKGWARNALDHLILARLETEGLQPAPEADRFTLARRVSLDLTGLPPTIEAVDRFVNDPSPDAYEKYVDRVLDSPAYGEHWAHVWLDLARYADSNGYASDALRTIWKYRDWVIDAINANMPFDEFTIEQLAGDLLPRPTTEQILATAFHRNTLTNDEGGTSDEEFRVAAVVDRVNTTMQVWMGITMGCAQCHDHKYDPITQEEYFRLFAIFNQSEDADRADNAPLLPILAPAQQKERKRLESEIAVLEMRIDKLAPQFEAARERWENQVKPSDRLPKDIRAILNVAPAMRQAAQKAALAKYYRSIAPELKKENDRLAEVRRQLAGIKPVTTPIMRELPANKKRVTKIHIRGNFLNQGKQVQPGVPVVFPPLLAGQSTDRLALARWLVSPQNPLTARVAVNRYWEQIFGVGLVETPEDFGIRGKLPTHPDLLDWLATEFIARAWDVKKLLRLLVTSATYRQSSRVSPALVQRDPDNRLFARGPRFRASAEVIRDQTLFVSGLLSKKMHGPPVRPPQPKLGLTAAFGGGTDWESSPGEDRYRRALYTQWRRTTPYPSMTTFDAPNRTVCTVNRPRTNTPLQALCSLNDPVYIEAAQALARRIVKEGGATLETRARHGFRLCLARPPQQTEFKRLVDLYRQAHEKYAANKEAARDMASSPLGPIPPGMDAVDLAAWTVVSNVLLNLDEMFARR